MRLVMPRLGCMEVACPQGANFDKPAIAQLAEHLTVDSCSYQMVPGSIPGGRTLTSTCVAFVLI